MTTKTYPALTRFVWVGVLVLFLAGACKLFFALSPGVEKKEIARPLPHFGGIPFFALTDAAGKEVTQADLLGHVWIADFIFTRCAGPCPLMTAKMRRLAEQLQNDKEMRFVSFSVDPEHDTPEILGAYAKQHQARRDRWFFLTGPKADIFTLARQHFRLGVLELSPGERESVDQAVSHSTKFVLIDQKGKIRGYYDSEDIFSMSRLIEDAKTLSSGRF